VINHVRPMLSVCRQRLHSASRHQLIVASAVGHLLLQARLPGTHCQTISNLRDPSLSEDTFRRSLKTYMFALYWYTKRIRGVA